MTVRTLSGGLLLVRNVGSVILKFRRLSVVSGRYVTVRVLVTLYRRTSPYARIAPSGINERRRSFLHFLRSDVIGESVLTFEVARVGFDLLLIYAVGATRTLRGLNGT